jgi:hypothetical protein
MRKQKMMNKGLYPIFKGINHSRLESASYSFFIETRLDIGLGLVSTGESASSTGIEIN